MIIMVMKLLTTYIHWISPWDPPDVLPVLPCRWRYEAGVGNELEKKMREDDERLGIPDGRRV